MFKEGDTFWTECGRGRVSYHPDWAPGLPWCVYVDGTAWIAKGSLQAAMDYLRQRWPSLRRLHRVVNQYPVRVAA
jgi:hypothetical protein